MIFAERRDAMKATRLMQGNGRRLTIPGLEVLDPIAKLDSFLLKFSQDRLCFKGCFTKKGQGLFAPRIAGPDNQRTRFHAQCLYFTSRCFKAEPILPVDR